MVIVLSVVFLLKDQFLLNKHDYMVFALSGNLIFGRISHFVMKIHHFQSDTHRLTGSQKNEKLEVKDCPYMSSCHVSDMIPQQAWLSGVNRHVFAMICW